MKKTGRKSGHWPRIERVLREHTEPGKGLTAHRIVEEICNMTGSSGRTIRFAPEPRQVGAMLAKQKELVGKIKHQPNSEDEWFWIGD